MIDCQLALQQTGSLPSSYDGWDTILFTLFKRKKRNNFIICFLAIKLYSNSAVLSHTTELRLLVSESSTSHMLRHYMFFNPYLQYWHHLPK